MSNSPVNHPLFLVSAALNIFFVAFIFGRLSGQPAFMPPPPFMGGQGGPQAAGGPPGMPPFMGPDDLFSPKEKEENFAALKTQFDKARDMREGFAAKLKAGPVAKEDILAHFTQVDNLMDEIKSSMKEKIADKLSKLDQKGRDDFADHLLKKHDGEPGCPPRGVNDHGPQGADDHGPQGADDHGPPPDAPPAPEGDKPADDK